VSSRPEEGPLQQEEASADRGSPGPPARPDVKSRQRIDYGRLAAVLSERGIVDARAIQDALQFSQRGGPPFPEALVTANLVADWELTRLACEIYGLPFLTVGLADPDPKASEGLDSSFLLKECIVPLSRHGSVLTVLMPSLTTTDVLDELASKSGTTVLPICGTVRTNRDWLVQKFSSPTPSISPAAAASVSPANDPGTPPEGMTTAEWSNLFDEADAAVLFDLKQVPPEEGSAAA
jgi:hypothetical protein